MQFYFPFFLHQTQIDRTWRTIMKSTNDDRRVIQSTDFPSLLNILRAAFGDLEKVQKGLNTYLEKKRIFFARFFFLSNDEILEILSETKEPKRVQPHLRKCFEGVCTHLLVSASRPVKLSINHYPTFVMMSATCTLLLVSLNIYDNYRF